MKIKELLIYGINELKKAQIIDASIQARVLLCWLMKLNRIQLIISSEKTVNNTIIELYKKAIQEIVQGRPLQYITNNQEFMKLNFFVNENVLIPQPSTETLVEEVLKYTKTLKKRSIKILDLCTGSGAIAIALSKNIKNVEIIATDISIEALKIAKINAEKNQVSNKIKFIQSDMFNNIEENEFDIIVSNPPYIKTDVIKLLSKQVQNEPHIALDGGKEGIDYYKIIIENMYYYLIKNGALFLEIGSDQRNDLFKLFERKQGITFIRCIQDIENMDRVIFIK